MYSRIVVAPSGRQTMSRRTSSSAPSKTRAPSTRVSSKCRSDETTLRAGRGSAAIEPVLCDKKIAVELRLARPRRRLPLVAPFDERRERQKNRFGTSTRLQTEQRPAIPHQVEFDVAAAAIRLEIALVFAVRQILTPSENRLVCREEMIADRFGQREAALESAVCDVVKKNPADAPRLAAMLQ